MIWRGGGGGCARWLKWNTTSELKLIGREEELAKTFQSRHFGCYVVRSWPPTTRSKESTTTSRGCWNTDNNGTGGGGCVIPGIFGRDRIPRMSPSPRNGATNESVTRSFNNPSTQNNGRLLCPFASIHYFASDLDTRARALVESFYVQFVPIDRLANRRG